MTTATVVAPDVVEDVLEAYDRWGLGPKVGGEWGHIREVARMDYHAALAAHDRDMLADILTPPVHRLIEKGSLGVHCPEWYGLMSPPVDEDEAAWRSVLGRVANTDRLLGPGDPPGVQYPDVMRHDAEAYRMAKHGSRVIEIGGGYGGMAYQLTRHLPAVHYVNIDIPDTLFLCYAFLRGRLPKGMVSLGGPAPIRLIPAHAIPDLGTGWDVVCNFRSWGEMDAPEIARYFALIEQWRPWWVIHENAVRISPDSDPAALAKYEEGVASRGFRDIPANDYPPLEGYALYNMEQSLWQVGARYKRIELRREP